MSKHTPRRWVIFDEDVCDEDGNWIARCGESRIFDDAEREANARLIAAAPEMLEALKDVLRRIDDSSAWWMGAKDKGGLDTQMIVAAVAKAEGRKP